MQNEINSADSLLAPSVALHPARTAGELMAIGLPRQYGAPLATARNAAQEWIGFDVANIKFLVPHAHVSEISEMLPIFRIPNTGRWLLGLVNLHGNLVPVFDLASLVGGACGTKSKTMLLVLGRGESIAAIVVNGIPNRKCFDASNRTPLPAFPAAIRDYVSNAYAEEATVWLELYHTRFFETMARRIPG